MEEKTIKFNTSDFLSKWGFQDGDILYDYFDEVWCDKTSLSEHRFLEKILKELVVPKLDQKIELVFIESIHNPVRAKTVNGKEVTTWWSNPSEEKEHTITPQIIEIPISEIIKLL